MRHTGTEDSPSVSPEKDASPDTKHGSTLNLHSGLAELSYGSVE